MTDWERLVKPALRGVGAYDPGPSPDEQLAALGLDGVAKLNWNEGLWGPLPGVAEAVTATLDQVSSYPAHAYDTLRAAIAADAGVRAEQIQPAHGIQALIIMLVAACVREGDTVVVPEPTYGLYAQASRVAGAEVERVAAPGLELDLERIADAVVRTRARLVWICDPNNPTGDRLDAGDWRAFLAAVGPDCIVVADEAYADYVEPGKRIRRADDVDAGRPVVILRTFSKLYGLAGLRLGYAIADPALLGLLNSVQEPFNVNRAALAAGLASLGRREEVAARRAEVAAARSRFAARLTEGGMTPRPSAANFVLVDVGVDDAPLTERLARRGFLIRPGAELGLPGRARITIGPAAVMEPAAAALLEVRDELAAAVTA